MKRQVKSFLAIFFLYVQVLFRWEKGAWKNRFKGVLSARMT